MAIIYTRLIEIGIIILIGGAILIITRIKDRILFKKWGNKWLKNSFEFEGSRYHKKYFFIKDGKINHNL